MKGIFHKKNIAEEGSFRSLFRKETYEQRPFAYLLLWVLVSFALNIFIEILGRKSLTAVLVYMVYHPMVFLYNTVLIMATLSIMFLVRRRFFALLMGGLLWMTIGIANGVLLIFRTTPFTAQDLKLIKYAVSLMQDYIHIWGIVLLGIAILGALVLLVIVWMKAPVMVRPIKRFRNLLCAGAFVFLALIMTQIGLRVSLLGENYANIGQAYQDYGIPYCFLNTLLNTGIDKPADYGDDKVEDILDEDMVNEDEPETETETETITTATTSTPNVIVVQLESFFNVTDLENVSFSQDPIPNMHELMDAYTSGYLSMPVVGAGTANSEFEVITGMNLDFFGPGEYPYKTVLQKNTSESIAYNLMELGYGTHAIHNNEGTFYDRNKVFSQLGFETFTSIEYMNNITTTETGWAEDKGLTKEILTAMDSTTSADLVYTISVQGHGAYPTTAVIEDPVITVEGLSDEALTNQYTYYVNQLYEMDQFIGELVDALEDSGEPCVLVLFGDHLPSLGITETDLSTGDLFETPYAVWDNFQLDVQDRDLEAYQLMAYVLDQLDIHKGTLTRFHQKFLNSEDELVASIAEEEADAEETVSQEKETEEVEEASGEEAVTEEETITKESTAETRADDTPADGVYTEEDAENTSSKKETSTDETTQEETQKEEELTPLQEELVALQEKYLEDLKVLEYDMLYGDQLVYEGETPYTATDLQMGVRKISISSVTYADDIAYVMGQNFTEYSKVMVNGELYETEYVTNRLVLVRNVSLEDGDTLAVAQVGKDGVTLSTSAEVTYGTPKETAAEE